MSAPSLPLLPTSTRSTYLQPKCLNNGHPLVSTAPNIVTFKPSRKTKVAADKSTSNNVTTLPMVTHCGQQDVATPIVCHETAHFLPRLRLPKAWDKKSWNAVDNWVKDNIAQEVLQVSGVESKYHIIRDRLFSYLL